MKTVKEMCFIVIHLGVTGTIDLNMTHHAVKDKLTVLYHDCCIQAADLTELFHCCWK